jgi:hypothetical protein
MKNNWCLTSWTTQNTTLKPKNCTIFPHILRERDADKPRLGRWNSKYRRYLWRTIDVSHPEPHKTRLRNIKFAPFFFLSSEKVMLIKRVYDVRIQNFDVIYEEQVMSHIQKTHKTRLRNIRIAPFKLLSSQKEVLRKRVFSQRKCGKWTLSSGRWNSKFWGYLWRTCDVSHPEPHKTRLRNIIIAPHFLLSSEKLMQVKRV